MNLEAEGGGARVAGVGVLGGLGAVQPDLEAVAAGTDTEGVPLAFLEEGSDALAAAGLRVDIALRAGVETTGHVNLERVGLAQLDLQLRLTQKHTRVDNTGPHHLEREVKVLILRLGVERRAGLLLIVDPDNRAILNRPNTRIPGRPPACKRTAIEEVAVDRRRLRLHGRGDGSHGCVKRSRIHRYSQVGCTYGVYL